MAGFKRFFMRFNLQGHFPATAEVFERLLPYSKEELAPELDDFERIQNTRAECLKQKYEKEIEILRGKKVLFLGDSITSDNLGYRGSVTRAAELQAYDESISGGTSPMLLHIAKRKLETLKPDIVSIMLGSNDSVGIENESLNQVSLGEYTRNIEQMVLWAKRNGTEVLLFEMPLVHEKRFQRNFEAEGKLQSNENIVRYNNALKKIANNLDIKLIQNSWLGDCADMDSLFEIDGIHLSLLGHERCAEEWMQAAAKLFSEN